jgi:hypothetical protein
MHVIVTPRQHLVVVCELALCQARDRDLLFHFMCDQRALHEPQVAKLILLLVVGGGGGGDDCLFREKQNDEYIRVSKT